MSKDLMVEGLPVNNLKPVGIEDTEVIIDQNRLEKLLKDIKRGFGEVHSITDKKNISFADFEFLAVLASGHIKTPITDPYQSELREQLQNEMNKIKLYYKANMPNQSYKEDINYKGLQDRLSSMTRETLRVHNNVGLKLRYVGIPDAYLVVKRYQKKPISVAPFNTFDEYVKVEKVSNGDIIIMSLDDLIVFGCLTGSSTLDKVQMKRSNYQLSREDINAINTISKDVLALECQIASENVGIGNSLDSLKSQLLKKQYDLVLLSAGKYHIRWKNLQEHNGELVKSIHDETIKRNVSKMVIVNGTETYIAKDEFEEALGFINNYSARQSAKSVIPVITDTERVFLSRHINIKNN